MTTYWLHPDVTVRPFDWETVVFDRRSLQIYTLGPAAYARLRRLLGEDVSGAGGKQLLDDDQRQDDELARSLLALGILVPESAEPETRPPDDHGGGSRRRFAALYKRVRP